MQNLITTLYDTSMQIGSGVVEHGNDLSELDKVLIMDSVGALLSTIGIAHFNGTYSIEQLKSDLSPSAVEHPTYKWQSAKMGNIVENFGDVIRQVWDSLVHYHTIDIKWHYCRKGF